MLENRIRPLNSKTHNNGETVLYVMSRDQRLHDNHALLAAQQSAIARKLPLLIIFNFTVHNSRSKEHYQFMIEGLEELEQSAKSFNIPVIFLFEDSQGLLNKLEKLQPSAIYFDFSPLKGPRRLRSFIASNVSSACFEVDTHNIIPAWIASDHQEFAAHTFRSKVHKHLGAYLAEPAKLASHPYTPSDSFAHPLSQSSNEVLAKVKSCGIKVNTQPGEMHAQKHLKNFITGQLDSFALTRNDPSQDGLSGLSPYLHFGQLSSLRVALNILNVAKNEPLLLRESRMASAGDKPSLSDGMNALLEEMIVRKELSDNFCLYAKSYTDISSVPAWAQTTLREHASDKREFVYTRQQWEQSQTHDPAWNAAQNQLRATGKIHGYMRMYWAKKMLEWSTSPEDAITDCIYLNDKYSIDGGDPNGYVGILWSIAGLHDRPWTERPVFGKIRYMNYGGLKRKFNIESYIAEWTNQTNLL